MGPDPSRWDYATASMEAGLALAIIGVALTVIGVALTVRAIQESRRSQQELAAHLTEISHRIVLRDPSVGSKAGKVDYVAVDAADVDHDGHPELLIQHWAGNRATVLRVMGWDANHEFQDLASLTTGTPAGFTVGDLDGDGRIEI